MKNIFLLSTSAFAADVSGTCKSERGTVQFTGKVEGDRIEWGYKTESEGGPVTVVFKGKVASQDKMSGSVLAVEFSVEGEFSATRMRP
jgi:preprotein translocase subunit SecD